MTPSDVLKLIKEKQAKFADLRFTDTRGKEQHVTIPARLVDEEFFGDGKMFDGSSIAGWKGINESDMILMPDANTAVIDPFFEETTVDIRCDVIEPMTMQNAKPWIPSPPSTYRITTVMNTVDASVAPASPASRSLVRGVMGSTSIRKQVPVTRTSPAGVCTTNDPPRSTR